MKEKRTFIVIVQVVLLDPNETCALKNIKCSVLTALETPVPFPLRGGSIKSDPRQGSRKVYNLLKPFLYPLTAGAAPKCKRRGTDRGTGYFSL